MKKLVSLLFFIFFMVSNAQKHEIGFFGGGSNFVGDIGPTRFISPNQPVVGILYKWNKSPRFAYRFSFQRARISGKDSKSDDPGREARNLFFINSIKELSAGFEFNFNKFDLNRSQRQLTPYVHSGLNVFQIQDYYFVGTQVKNNGTATKLAIPITLGLKTNVFPRIILGAEIGARYALTDNIEGNNPDDASRIKFGNINNNDWYVFSGFTLTYTFGEKPCYCPR